jgi:hypothetical protein
VTLSVSQCSGTTTIAYSTNRPVQLVREHRHLYVVHRSAQNIQHDRMEFLAHHRPLTQGQTAKRLPLRACPLIVVPVAALQRRDDRYVWIKDGVRAGRFCLLRLHPPCRHVRVAVAEEGKISVKRGDQGFGDVYSWFPPRVRVCSWLLVSKSPWVISGPKVVQAGRLTAVSESVYTPPFSSSAKYLSCQPCSLPSCRFRLALSHQS